MTREEAIQWLKAINTREFGWDEFALQESQREIRERCEQGVREAIDMAIEALKADAVPKWNCTANFVAEQLDRLRNMTDEERWDFFIRFFSPSADAVPQSEQYKKGFEDCKRAYEIELARSADAVKVVRCKDCRWWRGNQSTKHNNHLCKRALDQNVEYWTRCDDYCSYGERKNK